MAPRDMVVVIPPSAPRQVQAAWTAWRQRHADRRIADDEIEIRQGRRVDAAGRPGDFAAYLISRAALVREGIDE